jgi:hypothetical protein
VLRDVAGQPDLSIEHFNRSMRLSPRDQLGVLELSFLAQLISSKSSSTMRQQSCSYRCKRLRVSG